MNQMHLSQSTDQNSDGVSVAKVIYINGLHPLVEALNFDRLKWKLCESGEAKMSKEECSLAEREYRRYLTLKVLYPQTELVPSKPADEFWHAHILDTAAYQQDCDTVFGYFLHHFPYFGIFGDEDYQNLVSAFSHTKGLYEQHFGKYPEKVDSAARCADHACHAPSSCACRTPGACK